VKHNDLLGRGLFRPRISRHASNDREWPVAATSWPGVAGDFFANAEQNSALDRRDSITFYANPA
jgi:hypothetical protein